MKPFVRQANANVKVLVDYLRAEGLLGDNVADMLRDYRNDQEEVLHNAALAADDLARRIAAFEPGGVVAEMAAQLKALLDRSVPMTRDWRDDAGILAARSALTRYEESKG